MALIKCSECGREISDRAEVCLGCGAPISVSVKQHSRVPTAVHYNRDTDTFTGTMILIVKLAMLAVQELGWKLDQANETLGMLTFQTGISWGSWSGVTCSLNIEEVSPNTFRVRGTAKQNPSGIIRISLDVFGEAQKTVDKAIHRMKQLAV